MFYLQKFFDTIRGAAGSNEHPTCPTFFVLYRMLSIYSLIKPPKYGNCTLTEKNFSPLISVEDIREAYTKSESASATALHSLKQKLDNIINYKNYEADEVIEHDYFQFPTLDCIIYYVTGFYIILFYLSP